jgi:mannose-6-phosphate isomerase-like protein (cupin superfamily)
MPQTSLGTTEAGLAQRLQPVVIPPVVRDDVISIEDLRRSATAALFEGRDHVAISIFVNEYELGQGPSLHLHPYPEVFVVQAGTAAFAVGDDELILTGAHIVAVPARTPHAFKGAGDDRLRVVSVNPSGTVEQTNL